MLLAIFNNKRGQSLSEYAILIGMVVAALISMQGFLKRRSQAIIMDSISAFGDPYFTKTGDPLEKGEDITSYRSTNSLILTGKIGLGSAGDRTIEEEEKRRVGYTHKKEDY